MCKPLIRPDRTQHDFGTVELGETCRTTFSLTSTGNGPMVILDAKVNCQCTQVDFPGKPLAQREKAMITIIFEAKDAGIFNKTVRILTNASRPASGVRASDNRCSKYKMMKQILSIFVYFSGVFAVRLHQRAD
ncbi:MAG: DUF1573 domain-containing protein [Alistipes indistinctus]